MKRRHIVKVLLILAIAASANAVFAQTGASDGIVAGRVLHSDGTPAVGVDIVLLAIPNPTCVAGPYAVTTGSGSLATLSAHARTDGAGRYRMEKLTAGRYSLATGRLWIPQGGGGPCYFPRRSIISDPIFLPGVTDPNAATVLNVASGASTVPDFRLPEPIPGIAGIRVGGRVSGAPAVRDDEVLRVEMRSGGPRGNGACRTITANVGPDGAFELRNVPPCTYVIAAQRWGGDYSFSLSPGTTIEVTDQDVTGLVLSGSGAAR